MPHYKLTYFNVRAKAEVARLLFSIAGVEYEDERIEFSSWPDLKPSTPFGQLPVLEVNGVQLCQSLTIARFLANQFGLAGKSDWEKAWADMIVDCIEDVVANIGLIIHENDEVAKDELKRKFEEKLPVYLGNLEKLLRQNKGGDGYFVGDSLTWADLAFVHLFSWVALAGLPVPVDDCPKLKALKERVEAEPRVADWFVRRPETR